MVLYKITDLVAQARVQPFRCHGKVGVSWHLIGKQVQPVLDSAHPVFQSKIENRPSMDGKIPDRLPLGDADAPVQHHLRLPNFCRPAEHTHPLVETDISYWDFFRGAPAPNPNRDKVTGSICGVKVEAVQDPLLRDIRVLDKLVDELAKGKPLEKVLRK